MTSKMSYKVHISEINTLGYLQRVAMLKFLIIMMLEMTMLSFTESSYHDRVASLCCLQKLVHMIEHMHEKVYENFYVWSDGMGFRSQFRSRYIFKLLASKGPMDRIGETVKNVILRKVKSGHLLVVFFT